MVEESARNDAPVPGLCSPAKVTQSPAEDTWGEGVGGEPEAGGSNFSSSSLAQLSHFS
jgi:hypothetical protein